jgi:AcrR family transcriptional regulator
MNADWLVGDHDAVAAERILDAAGECFARRGVVRTSMATVAAAAGCSRQTLYRYFEDRTALRTAFVHREARRVGLDVARKVGRVRDPETRLVRAMLAALDGVRTDATLAAWFSGSDVTAATDIAAHSPVLESLVAGFLGEPSDDRTRETARWVVRVMLSLLAMPGADPREERAMLERFVVPVVLPRPVRTRS